MVCGLSRPDQFGFGLSAISMKAKRSLKARRFLELPSAQASDLLPVRNRGTAKRGAVIVKRLRIQPEYTSTFARDTPTRKTVRNEELDFMPEIENGHKPFPFGAIYVRLHDVSLEGCKVIG